VKVSRLLAVVLFIYGCGAAGSQPETPAEIAVQEGARKTSTDPAVNPDAAAMAEFKARVEEYAELHRRLAKGDARHKETSDPAKINKATETLAARVQAARADAKHGDIFTPLVRPAIRRLLAPELKARTAATPGPFFWTTRLRRGPCPSR
jgi:hypothetical protein